MTKIDLNANEADIQTEIENELARSKTIHAPVISSFDEALGIMMEEFLETAEAFRTSKEKYPEGNIKLRRELCQLSAMCLKTIESCCGVDPDMMIADMVSCPPPMHKTTMVSFGIITRMFDAVRLEYQKPERIYEPDMLGLLLILAVACKGAILSHCVNRKEVKNAS